MKNLIGLICLFSITFFTSCSKDDVIKIGEEFEVKIEETFAFEEGGFEIKFIKVEDSRCPSDAICVWEGRGVADLQITPIENENTTVQLATAPSLVDSLTKTAVYDNYIIELIDLLPYPDTNTTNDEYSVVLKITNQ